MTNPWLAIRPEPLLSTSCLEPISAHEVHYLLGRPLDRADKKEPVTASSVAGFFVERRLMLPSVSGCSPRPLYLVPGAHFSVTVAADAVVIAIEAVHVRPGDGRVRRDHRIVSFPASAVQIDAAILHSS